MARPRLLTPELQEKAESYLGLWESIGDTVPSVESFAVFLGIARSTAYAWAAENDEFSDILESVNARQARELINRGLKGDFPPVMAKLLLSKHGHNDRAEVTNTLQGPGGTPVQVESKIDVTQLSNSALAELADLRRNQGED